MVHLSRSLLASTLLFAGIAAMPWPAAADHFVPASLETEPATDTPVGRELMVASLGASPDWLAGELGFGGSPQKPLPDAGSSGLPGPGQDRAAAGGSLGADAPPADSRPAPTSVVAAGPGAALRPEVRQFIDRFQSPSLRATVELWLSRAGRYASMIRHALARKGLPEDLLFTAMMESGLDPLASSSAGAKGLWQFMATTARRYGLRVDGWLDERLDPEKSTVAAASYLRDLYAMFGSWHLAQAAYNAGEMRVARAIQEVRTNDFWRLAQTRHLSDETKAFVAAAQALTVIGREPGRYGFAAVPDEPLRYDVVPVPGGTTLAAVARVLGVSLSTLSGLNPSLRLGQTPPGQPHAVKVPVGAGPRVTASLSGGSKSTGPKVVAASRRPPREAPALPLASVVAGRSRSIPVQEPGPAQAIQRPDTEPAVRPAAAPGVAVASVHVVRAQDTIKDIARRYGVSVGDIIRWNQLTEADRIFPGNRLRVASLGRSGRDGVEEEGEGGFR